ncbi:hypothetical protein D9619_011000 [Psilocybe cf. subviscida]|uniref:Uncharacterized protein n=1 Tax=Psilocybe cf. subviscida TaxID=2480587 RepID=A0A8H5F063_9AGAR|nr:hypothetical protein D9619_011000 [Psilocybe cf. subviscida]
MTSNTQNMAGYIHSLTLPSRASTPPTTASVQHHLDASTPRENRDSRIEYTSQRRRMSRSCSRVRPRNRLLTRPQTRTRLQTRKLELDADVERGIQCIEHGHQQRRVDDRDLRGLQRRETAGRPHDQSQAKMGGRGTPLGTPAGSETTSAVSLGLGLESYQYQRFGTGTRTNGNGDNGDLKIREERSRGIGGATGSKTRLKSRPGSLSLPRRVASHRVDVHAVSSVDAAGSLASCGIRVCSYSYSVSKQDDESAG